VKEDCDERIWLARQAAEGTVLVGQPEHRRSLGRPRRGWKCNFTEIRREGADWIRLSRNRVKWRAFVNAVMKHRVPQNVRNFLAS